MQKQTINQTRTLRGTRINLKTEKKQELKIVLEDMAEVWASNPNMWAMVKAKIYVDAGKSENNPIGYASRDHIFIKDAVENGRMVHYFLRGDGEGAYAGIVKDDDQRCLAILAATERSA